MTIIFNEDELVDQIIEADAMEPVEGARGSVMIEFENEGISIEVMPCLRVWGADLVLSNNFTIEKHNQLFLYTRRFLERRLGIMQFNVYGSHGEILNGFDFEKQYIINKYKDSPEFESIMKEWERQRRQLEHL